MIKSTAIFNNNIEVCQGESQFPAVIPRLMVIVTKGFFTVISRGLPQFESDFLKDSTSLPDKVENEKDESQVQNCLESFMLQAGGGLHRLGFRGFNTPFSDLPGNDIDQPGENPGLVLSLQLDETPEPLRFYQGEFFALLCLKEDRMRRARPLTDVHYRSPDPHKIGMNRPGNCDNREKKDKKGENYGNWRF